MDAKKTFCRLCFGKINENVDFINVFDEASKKANISEILEQHYGIEVHNDSIKSTNICMVCWTITNNFHKLYELVKVNESSSYFADDHFENYEENHETTPVENTISDPIDLAEHVKSEYDTRSDGSKSSSVSPSVSVVRKSQIVKKVKTETVDRKQRSEKFEQENQQIRDFFSMNCEMCDLKFHTVNEARQHYKQKHNKAGYLTCCGKKFFRRCMALDHIQQHLNPEQLKCELCDKTYSTTYVLRNHMMSHENGLDNTGFTCSICMQTFVNKMQLSQHMRRKHLCSEEKKFGCDICGKFFVTKRVLTTHIRGVHENAFAQMCHVCARTFKSKHVYQQHLLEHLETELPKLQCNICGAWLKNDRGLRLHLVRHTETEVRCTICNKQTPNRHALGMHMRYVHSEAKYKCTVCDKSFKKPIGLKEHMASHTGVDLYACPYCAKTFKSGANMHSHRKKEHFELWTQDRHQRYTPRLTSTDNST